MEPLHSVLLFLSPEAVSDDVPLEVVVVYPAVSCIKTTSSIKTEAAVAATRKPQERKQAALLTWTFDLQCAQHLCFLNLQCQRSFELLTISV